MRGQHISVHHQHRHPPCKWKQLMWIDVELHPDAFNHWSFIYRTCIYAGFSWSLQHHLWYTSCNNHPCRQYRTQGPIILSQRRHRISLLLFVVQVTVALIDLSPELSYTSVPRLSPHSFLQAKAKNTSHYAMLAGPSNIFLDNNFIAKVIVTYAGRVIALPIQNPVFIRPCKFLRPARISFWLLAARMHKG